ncbi:unnamed protein product [Scytosiphon promiscuus]
MLARSLSRAAASSARHVRDGPRACISSFVGGGSWCAVGPQRRPLACGVVAVLPEQGKISSSRRYLSSSRPPSDVGDEGDEVDVTPVGYGPGQITPEAIAEAEAADDLDDGDDGGDLEAANIPADWEYEASTEDAFDAGRSPGIGPDGEEEEDAEEAPPTPILDAYERSKDPAEMERLIAMSFDALPERAGPQRYNHKRREHQRFRTIRKIKYKEKLQREAAYERKLQKRRDRKARDQALFATWRGTGTGTAEEGAVQR